MTGVRESVARAVNSSNLGENGDEWETNLDRIGALAFAPRLGAAFLRWRDGQDASFRERVLVELVRESLRLARVKRWKCSAGQVYAIAGRVLFEVEHDQCETCGGHGMIGIRRDVAPDPATKPGICPDCRGSKKRQFDAADRARALKISVDEWRTHVEPRFQRVRATLFGSVKQMTLVLKDQLERAP